MVVNKWLMLCLLVNMANGNTIPNGMSFTRQFEMQNNCISLEQREILFEQIRTYKNSRTMTDSVFLEDPMGNGGMFGSQNLILNYVDEDSAFNSVLDYYCSFATYDGHLGTDIIIPTFWHMDEMTTPVLAAANGNVVYTHDGEFDRQLDLDSTAVANLVAVEYDAGIYGLYGHLKKNSVRVEEGQFVLMGDTLGYVGSSGFSTWPHLHYELLDSDMNMIDPWHGECNPEASQWNNQYPFLDEHPTEVKNFISSSYPITSLADLRTAISENAPFRKHVNPGEIWWSYLMVMSLHKTDTLKWMFYKNGAYDYQISLVPGDNTNIWPDWLEIYPRSDWYQESTFPSGDDCHGNWTEKFYINSELIDSLMYVCDSIPNKSPNVHPAIFEMMADGIITAEINSDDNDGTIIWNSASIPPQHGTFTTFGGYQKNFIYTPNLGFSGLDSVQIMAMDDKGSTDIGVHYFDVQYLGLTNPSIPKQFELFQNYPNPFNPMTTLRYGLVDRANVTITIYDIIGKRVRTFDRGEEASGIKSLVWNGTDDHGKPLSAGIYLIQLQTGNFTQTRKMILLK
jgi:hypothetical protein